MPLGVEFVDKHARRGGVHDSISRVLAINKNGKVRWHYSLNGNFYIDIPENFYDGSPSRKIKVTKRNAQLLAEWITQMVGERVR